MRADVHLGIPRRGLDLESEPRQDGPKAPHDWAARKLDNVRFHTSGLAAHFTAADLGSTNPYDANTVGRIAAIPWFNNTTDLIRHTHASVTNFTSGAWANINLTPLTLNATSGIRWGGAVVPSAADGAVGITAGKGIYLFSCAYDTAADHIYFWGGTRIYSTWLTGNPEPGRFVIGFADRAFVMNQMVGGTLYANRIQWSIPGEARSWSAPGAGAADLPQVGPEITGVGILRGVMFVYGENNIVAGTEAYDLDFPVYFNTVLSQGVGVWAPGSFVSYLDNHAFLAREGFFSFDGRNFDPIGAQITSYILDNINIDALKLISAVYLPGPYNLLIWALPLFGSSYPNVWAVYDIPRRAWSMIPVPFSGLSGGASRYTTAMTVQSRSIGYSWDDLDADPDIFGVVGAIGPPSTMSTTWAELDAVPLSWAELGGSATTQRIVAGTHDGYVYIMNPTDSMAQQVVVIDSPSFTFDGVPIIYDEKTSSRARSYYHTVVRPDHAKTLTSVTISYTTRTSTAASSMHVFVSIDEGRTFTYFGTAAFNTSVANTQRRVTVYGRITGETLRLRFTNVYTLGAYPYNVEINDLRLSFKVSGDVRDETRL